MARKDQLDFGDFEFDDLDFNFDDDQSQNKKPKSDKPIDEILGGVRSSMKDKFTDPYHLRSMMRKALPRGLGRTWDAISDVGDDTRRLYDEATKEIRPQLSSITRKLDQLVPEGAGKARRMTDFLKDKLGMTDEVDNYGSRTDDQTQRGVDTLLADLTAASEYNQEARHSQDRARSLVRDRVEDKKFVANQQMLGVIANESTAIRQYQQAFDTAFKRKSLELQFRSYSALTALLNNAVEQGRRAIKFQDALLVNTSLPEYAKTSNIQRWKQVSKERMFDNMNSSIFGKKSRIGMAGDRLMRMGREKLDEITDVMSMIDDGLEMALDAKQNGGDGMGPQASGWNMAGQMGGGMLGDFISDIISSKVKGLMEGNETIAKKSLNIGRMAANPGSIIEMVKKSKWFKDLGTGENDIIGESTKSGLTTVMQLLAGGSPDLTIKNTNIGSEGENKLKTEMRSARSIVEIIPGYLSRILREITVLRTGDNKTGLLMYDSNRGEFKTEATMAADIRKSLSKIASEAKVGKRTYAEEYERYENRFLGDEKISEDMMPEFRKFMTGLSRSNEDFDFTSESLKNTKEYEALSPEMKRRLDDIIAKRLEGDSLEATTNRYNMATGAMGTRGSMGNLMSYIQEALQNGQGSLLEKQGLVSRDKNDDWVVNNEKYYEYFDKTIKSDINSKTNIKPTQMGGPASLNAVNNIKMYDWQYKDGKASYTGPMAQDVRANFGSDTAPEGKEIDLVNLNGKLMSAVQELAKKVEGLDSPEALKYLASIDEKVGKILEKDFGSSGGPGGPGAGTGVGGGQYTGTGIAGNIGALVSGLINLGTTGITATAKAGAKGAKAAGEAGSKFWADNSAEIKQARDTVFRTSMRAMDAAVDFGTRMINVTVPEQMKRGMALVGKGVDAIKDLLHTTKDIFVEGRSSPAIQGYLLKAGYYRDKGTNKVLRTLDDVAKATGDIVDANGLTVLSLVDRAQGMIDGTGRKIKTFGMEMFHTVAGLAAAGASKLKEKFNELKNSESLKNAKDTVADKVLGAGKKIRESAKNMTENFSLNGIVGGRTDERAVPVLIQIRDLLAIGKRGKRVREILSRELPQVKFGKMSKADMESSEKAGNDQPGAAQQASTAAGNLTPNPVTGEPSNVSTQPASGGGAGGNVMDNLRNLGAAGKGAFNNLKDGVASRLPVPGSGTKAAGVMEKVTGVAGKVAESRVGKFATKGLGAVGSMVGGAARIGGTLLGAFSGGGSNPSNTAQNAGSDNYSAAEHGNRLDQLSKDRDVAAYNRSKGDSTDTNGDGQRDGGAADRAKDTADAAQANRERMRAGAEAARKGAEAKAARFSPADDAIMKMIKVATAGLSMLASSAGSIISMAAGLFGGGLLGKGVGLAGKAVGGLFKGGAKAIRGVGHLATGLGKIGGGIMSVANKVPGVGKVARVATGAMRIAQVVGLAGGAGGSMVVGAAGLLGSILASPVFIGAAAVGAVGYGGYKLYKYLNRNKIDDYQRIRVMQYGLDGTSATSEYNSKVTGLENYLLDGHLAFSNGIPSVNARSAKIEDILELFDIKPDNAEEVDKFTRWYQDRFQPVFLHHVTVLYRVDNKASLDKVGDLDDKKRLEYLNGADITGVWDYTTSPFQGLDILNDNPEPSRELIKTLAKSAGKNVQNKAKEGIKAGETDANAKDAKNAASPVKSAVPAASSQDAAKIVRPPPVNTPNRYALNDNTNGILAPQQAGETSAPTTAPQSAKGMPHGSMPTMSKTKFTTPPDVEEGVAPQGIDSSTLTGTPSAPVVTQDTAVGRLNMAKGEMVSPEGGEQYLKMGRGASIDGLNPRMKSLLLAMAKEYGETTGKSILINEGHRSYARQAELFRKYGRGRAAPPGSSLHEFGLAVDINTPIMNELESLGLLKKYGFTRPIRGETWHAEPAGIQSDIQRAKKDPAFADAAIAMSPGRGGGGYGANYHTAKGGRNPTMAKAVFEAGVGSPIDLQAKKKDEGTSDSPMMKASFSPSATPKPAAPFQSAMAPTASKTPDKATERVSTAPEKAAIDSPAPAAPQTEPPVSKPSMTEPPPKVTGTDLPVYTPKAPPTSRRAQVDSMRAPGAGFEAPAPRPSPMDITKPSPKGDGTTSTVLDELFSKMSIDSTEQRRVLSSIDTGINTKMVPLLERTAKAMEAVAEGITDAVKNNGAKDGASMPNAGKPQDRPQPNRKMAADTSSFENRRGVLT